MNDPYYPILQDPRVWIRIDPFGGRLVPACKNDIVIRDDIDGKIWRIVGSIDKNRLELRLIAQLDGGHSNGNKTVNVHAKSVMLLSQSQLLSIEAATGKNLNR